MISQDNRLIPSDGLDRSTDRQCSELAKGRPYGVSQIEPATLRDYLFVILKRKWLILSLVLVVTSLTTIQAFRAPSIYQGETTIRIEQRPTSILQTKEIVITGQADPNFWGTQLKLLQNPALARQVVLTLDIQHNQAFFGGGAQSGIFAALRRIFYKPPAKKEAPGTTGGPNIVSETELNTRNLTPEELPALQPYEDAVLGGEKNESASNTHLV